MIHYFILFLLTSPALSISAIFGFPFFPNEKLSMLLILFLFLFKKIQINNFHLIFFTSISMFFFIISLVQGIDDLKISNINTIYFFIAIIFYISYFKNFAQQFLRLLPIIVFVQILVSFFQQIMMMQGLHDFAMMFNNVPYQKNYIYPTISGGIFRTAGLFNEASQYSMFLLIYVILYYENQIYRSILTSCLFYLSLIDLILNQSITAYIIATLYILLKIFFVVRIKISTLIWSIISFISFSSFIFFFKDLIYDVFLFRIEKVFVRPGIDEKASRFYSAVDKIIYVSENSILTGYGLAWSNPVSWDVISVYYYGFGIFGLMAVLISLLYFTLETKNILIFFFLLFILVNGNLQLAINFIFIGSAYILRKNQINSIGAKNA